MLRKLGFTLLWPGLYFYFLGSRRARVMVRHEDEILLIRDSGRYFFDPNSWTIPGGGIKWREDPRVAAVRELREELGIELESDSLQFLAEQSSGSYGLRYTALFFEAVVPYKPTLVLPTKEVRNAQWFTPTAARRLPLKREAQQALALLAEDR